MWVLLKTAWVSGCCKGVEFLGISSGRLWPEDEEDLGVLSIGGEAFAESRVAAIAAAKAL